MTTRVQVIINPASGQAMPILHTLNSVFRSFGYDWDIAITKAAGDGKRLAAKAVDEGYDIVAAYGGDGTVAEVASGLIGTDVPLAILPGGTANVMSIELGIPRELAGACELFCADGCATRTVDMGQIGQRYFLLRAGVGFEAAMVQQADRESKEGMGVLAYMLSALNNLRHPPKAHYRLTLDGQTIESEGLTCIVANSGNLGRPGMNLVPGVDVTDGLLDVIIVRQADLISLLAVTANVAGLVEAEPAARSDDPHQARQETEKTLQHWQAKEIRVESDPIQPVQSDGEMIEDTPLECKVIPAAVRILVPSTSAVPR